MKRAMEIQQRVRDRRVPSGILASESADIQRRLDEGFRIIGLGFDTMLLVQAATQALEAAGRKVPESAWY